jgi:HK97 family phage major capsid protein
MTAIGRPNYREQRERHIQTMQGMLEKAKRENRSLTAAESAEFDRLEGVVTELGKHTGDNPRPGSDIYPYGVPTGRVHTVSRELTRRAASYVPLIGKDTHDLPSPDKPIEARHDVVAWLSQRSDYNPTNIDLGSFDRDAMWKQIMTGNQAGREYRALAEGAQSASASGGGVTVPISFSGNILPLLRAALLFTAAGADGAAVNGPTLMPMSSLIEYYPTFNSDATGVTSYVGENTALTPGTATLGRGVLTAWTMASVQLASRQLIDDTSVQGGIADLIETNTALAMARGMDASALYGTGSPQPWGIFSSQYSSVIQTISMGTNGNSPTNYNEVSRAVEAVRNQNEHGDLIIATSPSVFGTYSRLTASSGTYPLYWAPSADVAPYWPPKTSTEFSATETQGTSSAASSLLVLNPNRVLLGMRTDGIQFMTLTERYADALQYGFVAYLRHDWGFPYASAAARVTGILTT